MFDKLKQKLNEFKQTIDDKVKTISGAPAPEQAPTSSEVSQTPAATTPSTISSPTQAAQTEVLPAKPAEKSAGGILDRAIALTKGEVVLSEKDLEAPLWELEMALLESDVALPVAESIIKRVKEDLTGQHKKFLRSTGDLAEDVLRDSIASILNTSSLDFDDFVKKKDKPVIITFIGVNGAGKTTSIAKLGERLKEQGYSVVIAAGDTFRAGAIEQLEKHADRLGLKMIKHQQGADPAAVIYDAVQFAKNNKKDIVLADTAGRLHTNINLMEQLRKISRVVKPDLVIFVDEAIAGNDAVERAKLFNDAVPISGTILTKADADAKGGAAISIAHITGKPILFLGVGQEYKDLKKFETDWFIDRLFER